MPDTSRIEALRRRVEQDPASIAFAQLAEEYRRAGAPEVAVRVCRAGLQHHPNYLSARVTLGRALLELGQDDDARSELETVLRTAPDNLVAIRALADIRERQAAAETGAAAPVTPDEPAAPVVSDAPVAPAPFAPGASLAPVAPVAPAAPDAPVARDAPDAPVAAVLRLEQWLAAIRSDRERRRSRT